MTELPKNDLYVYQNLFETIYSKEQVREKTYDFFKNFRNDIERLQKCKFEELNSIYSKDVEEIATLLLEWLKFNFIKLQKETKELNEYYEIDENILFENYINYYFGEFLNFKEFIESFKCEKKEYERHKQLRRCKEETIKNCKHLLIAIIYKNRFISKFSKMLFFPEEYSKFEVALPKMIEYQGIFGKHVFYRGKITNQFLKWYKRYLEGGKK